MKKVFLLCSLLLTLSFDAHASDETYQRDFSGLDVSCQSDSDCSTFSYISECPGTLCINKKKSAPGVDVRLPPSGKTDCGMQIKANPFQGCQCLNGLCHTNFGNSYGKPYSLTLKPAAERQDGYDYFTRVDRQ